MDPYVKFVYMGTRYKTRIVEDGGQNPTWNQSFDISITSLSDEIQFEVKDDEVCGARLIGTLTIKASALCINNGVREWFDF